MLQLGDRSRRILEPKSHRFDDGASRERSREHEGQARVRIRPVWVNENIRHLLAQGRLAGVADAESPSRRSTILRRSFFRARVTSGFDVLHRPIDRWQRDLRPVLELALLEDLGEAVGVIRTLGDQSENDEFSAAELWLVVQGSVNSQRSV